MSETFATSIRIKAVDIKTRIIVEAIADKYGVQVVKPPRSKCALELQCTPEQFLTIVPETQRVSDCLELYSWHILPELLAAIDAKPRDRMYEFMTELAKEIDSDPELTSLFQHTGLSIEDVMQELTE